MIRARWEQARIGTRERLLTFFEKKMKIKNWNLGCCLAFALLIAVGCEKPSAPPAVSADDETATETRIAGPTADGERAVRAADVAKTMQRGTADTMTLKVPSDDKPASVPQQETIAPFSPGIAIGATIAPFSMADQTDTIRKLTDLMGEESKYVALVFYRSADW